MTSKFKLMLPNLSANKEGRCLKLLRLAPASDGETTRVHIGPPNRSRLIILASLKDLCNSHLSVAYCSLLKRSTAEGWQGLLVY